MRGTRGFALVTANALVIAGCSGGSGDSAEGAVEAGGMQAGQWESELTLTSISVPDAPEMEEFFNDAIGDTQTFSFCLTPEQAAKPDAGFFQGENADCTYDTFTMSGGKIESVMSCSEGESVMKVTMDGTYTSDSYEITSTAEGEMMPDTQGKMAMTAKAKRTGDCAAEGEGEAEG